MLFDVHMAMAVTLSGAIGLSLGLLGGGGSILAMPVLVFVAGIAPQTAVGMSLAIVAATSLLAAVLHGRSGHVDLRVAASFGAAGMVGAFLGAQLTPLVSERTLLLSFAGLMLAVGTWMLLGAGNRVAPRDPASGADGRPRPGLTLLAGVAVGGLTGFLGVGGGFLTVPALVLLTRLPMKRAVGTSLVVIALSSASGFVSHLGDGHIDVLQTAVFTAAALAGAIAGHRMASRLCPDRLRRSFAVFVILVGCVVAARTLMAFG
jgi:uncharacterized membrane protein YfcA